MRKSSRTSGPARPPHEFASKKRPHGSAAERDPKHRSAAGGAPARAPQDDVQESRPGPTLCPDDAAGTPPASAARPKEAPKAQLPGWLIEYLADGEPLPPELRALLADLVDPVYEEYVLKEPDPLARSAAYALVINATLELLEEPRLLQIARRAGQQPVVYGDEYRTVAAHHLQLEKARGRATELVLRIRRLLQERDPILFPPRGSRARDGGARG